MTFRYFICGVAAVIALASCQEEDNTLEEYPNWQVTNDDYFAGLVVDAMTKISTDESSRWALFPFYSFPAEANVELKYSDYIVVQKLEDAPEYETTSPMLTDSVEVHYVGRLLPSTTYTGGYEFDRSFPEPFDPATATPAKFSVKGVVKGFATALMNMHRGDRWKVYIPYQLGYGSTATTNIPAFSTLIFDIRLEDFWFKKKDDRL